MLLRSLQIALYVQFVLGLFLFFGKYVGFPANPGVGGIHALLGIIVAVMALIALRPKAGVPSNGIRTAAWLGPLVPLALGLSIMVHAVPGSSLTPVHMLLGIIVIGLVEGAAGQERRALRRAFR